MEPHELGQCVCVCVCVCVCSKRAVSTHPHIFASPHSTLLPTPTITLSHSHLHNPHRSVEFLDLEKGYWVPVESMLSRRSTLGVAVLKGELYAVGGFDGTNGLDSAEKYNFGEALAMQGMPAISVGCVLH